MIVFGGSGLPPQGHGVGGMSGWPLPMPVPNDRQVIWRFAGVIVQAAVGDMFEQVVAVRAHYIHPDGRLG